MSTVLIVRRDALATVQPLEEADPPLADGEIRLRVERYALTANNITYGAFGEAMNYWQFFPVPQAAGPGWGLIPVWGFARIVESRAAGLAAGERVWGYWPMADTAVLRPSAPAHGGFTDLAPHRAALHAVYNQYRLLREDAFHRDGSEDLQALLRPLYGTAWVLDDFLADNGFFGATRVLLSSASSKTAWSTALRLHERAGIEVVGLTSARNVAWCERLGVYHRVLGYDQLAALDPATATVYLDFSGDMPLRRAVHEGLPALAFSSAIGGTHLEQLGRGGPLPGPPPTLFFAPAQMKKRSAEWGAAEFGRRMVADWHAFVARLQASDPPWLEVRHHDGSAAALQAYAEVLSGRGDPRLGHVVRP